MATFGGLLMFTLPLPKVAVELVLDEAGEADLSKGVGDGVVVELP